MERRVPHRCLVGRIVVLAVMLEENPLTRLVDLVYEPRTRFERRTFFSHISFLKHLAVPRMILLRTVFLLLWMISFASAAEGLQFNRDIRPIFSRTCFACHGPDSQAREADLRLDVREHAVEERDGFQPIVPGNAEQSPVFQRIRAEDPSERMPPEDFHTQLSTLEIQRIKDWIDQGANYESHWAFIPPQRPDVAETSHPVDHFVQKQLEASGRRMAKLADRRTLIRRVSLDLTGIPPTADEVQAYVNDPGTEDAAFEKVVDRLLKSPHYAEHRTRFWLDAARYADTSGYQYDRIREQWIWRDWVINAFDQNMPFDQFTVEQIAGDLLPNPTPLNRLATGFHRNHPITIEGGVIDEEYRTEYVMDRVVTTTTTWLGLTFLCARCHDHKYDPISQDDFYGFYAFFNNVPERGLNGFDPKERIESPLNPVGLRELNQAVEEAQRKLDASLRTMDGEIANWESQLQKSVETEQRSVLPRELKANGGTQLVVQKDGSILATGSNPATQTYEIEFDVDETPVRAIRLEALTDPSHVNQSTGRGHNGNFVLSEFRVEASVDGAEFQPIEIAAAEADYEQKGYPISAAIDGKTGRGGWAVDGNTRFKDSTAVFTLAQTIEPSKGSRSDTGKARIRVRLIHTWGGSHTIGRFRLSVPADGMAPVPTPIRSTLATAKKDRKPEDQQALKRFIVSRFGGDAFRKLEKELQRSKERRDRAIKSVPDTMILREMPKPRITHVLMRGEYDKPLTDRPVAANVPGILGGLPKETPANRLGLARWIVSRQNPLTARVTVNRFWAQLFGVGLVKTIEDFGSQGEYPSHPELLDWLAVEFMESGWDVKRLFRTIVTSQTYRQSSHMTPASFADDPENRMLARGPRQRLDAETIRDSALFVAGLLDRSLGGPSVYPYHPKGLWLEINNRPGYSRAYPHTTETDALYRRSMYTFWKRTVPPPSMAAFDAPGREFCRVQRSRTNTPLQAFVMLHDPQFVEAARKLGERMLSEPGKTPKERLSLAFQWCLARPPQADELRSLHKALRKRLAFFSDHPSEADKLLSVGASPIPDGVQKNELAAYSTVARIILNLSEFITKG